MIKAYFKGEDGSMGYKSGKKYELHVAICKNKIIIRPTNGKLSMCPYDTLESFLNNWIIVQE